MKTFTTLLVIGMFATTVAIADDVDDVKAAIQRRQVAANSGDAFAGTQILLEGVTSFGPTGGLLERFDLEENRMSPAVHRLGQKCCLPPRGVASRRSHLQW